MSRGGRLHQRHIQKIPWTQKNIRCNSLHRKQNNHSLPTWNLLCHGCSQVRVLPWPHPHPRGGMCARRSELRVWNGETALTVYKELPQHLHRLSYPHPRVPLSAESTWNSSFHLRFSGADSVWSSIKGEQDTGINQDTIVCIGLLGLYEKITLAL